MKEVVLVVRRSSRADDRENLCLVPSSIYLVVRYSTIAHRTHMRQMANQEMKNLSPESIGSGESSFSTPKHDQHGVIVAPARNRFPSGDGDADFEA